jgi:hypothetical protein
MIWYLEDFCSSLLGHLQTLLYFPTVLDFRNVFETSRGSILLLRYFYTLFTLCPIETKRGSIC